MPVVAAAVIGGGAALAAGSMQSKAAKQSGQAVQQATDKSDATQRYIFDQARADNRVRQQTGDAASMQMARLMGLNVGPQAQPQQQQIGQQNYATGQPGANASYGGQNALARFENPTDMAMAPGMNVGVNALSGGGEAQVGTGQYGPAQQVPSGGQEQTGGNALGGQSPTDWLRSTPGYEFNFDEGARALNTRLAGQGRLQSGDAQREAVRYGQNYGDRIYGDQWNRLAGIAGAGQTASGQNQQAGQNYANNQTNLNMNNANARASSYQNNANAWGNALGGVAGAGSWALSQYPFGGGGAKAKPGGYAGGGVY